MTTDPREPLGRLVHDTRLACEADRAAAGGRTMFLLGAWEDRSEEQQELDMRIGAAVAAAERERAERAEAVIAEVRQAVITFRNRNAGTLDDQASDALEAVRQVIDRKPLRAQERSNEKEAGS